MSSGQPASPHDASWSAWFVGRLPEVAVAGLLYGLLTTYGPLSDADGGDDVASVLLRGTAFAVFLLAVKTAARWVRKRRTAENAR